MPAAVSIAPITATGMKGFLLWIQREQPVLFARIATKIPKAVPQAFSAYTARRKRLGRIYGARFPVGKPASLSGFAGYYSSYGSYNSYQSAPASYVAQPVTVNYTSQLNAVNYTASPSVDYNAQLSAPLYTASVNPGPLQTVNTGISSGTGISSSSIPLSANSGVIGTPATVVVSGLLGAAAAAAGLTADQQAALSGATATNAQRAAAGLAPLNTSLNSLGVPTVTTGSLSMETLLILGGAAALALVLLGDSK
jgi:hypothetical protein